MQQTIAGQPILILPEGTLRQIGKDAQKNNIAAAKAIASAIRTTLGPKGMDKMLVSSIGDIVITNDGVTILEEMEIEHPAAKLMVEVAKTLNQEVGDGTTTAVIIAGELLKKAEELLEKEIHPTIITKGYKLAKEEALKTLESMATKVSLEDEEILKKVALTSMTGKSAERASEKLAELVVTAIKKIAKVENGKIKIDKDDIKREKKYGAPAEETKLIDGIVIDKEVVHPGMPKRVLDARIALLDLALEVKETETDAQIRITSPEQLQAFLDQEQKMLRQMVEKIAKTGANVVFCQKGIDDVAQHYLAKKKILACRRVKKSDMEKLAKAVGGRVVSSLEDLSPEDLGYAKEIEEVKVGEEQMTFVKGCKNPKAVTILVRGTTEKVVDEVDRGIEDAIGAVSSSLEMGRIVPGAGAAEIEVARRLRKFAEKFSGKEQLAILGFADAVEVVPRSLAENAGLDPIDTIAAQRAAHDKGQVNAGIDVYTGEIKDAEQMGILEPLKVKTHAIAAATEGAELILRIDDVITAAKAEKTPPSGPPPEEE